MKFNFRNLCLAVICIMGAAVMAAALANPGIYIPVMAITGFVAGFMFPFLELK